MARQRGRKGPLIRPAAAGEYACRGPPSPQRKRESITAGEAPPRPYIGAAMRAWVFLVPARSQFRTERRLPARMGFPYPKVEGGPRRASSPAGAGRAYARRRDLETHKTTRALAPGR